MGVHNKIAVIVLIALILNVLIPTISALPLAKAQSTYNYGEALQKAVWFYMYQKAGRLPPNYPIIWRASAALKDGQDAGIDLTGGYFDAGDHVKFGLPMAYTIAQLGWAVYEYRQAFENAGLLDLIKDIIKWGADYFVKAHPQPYVFYYQVGDPGEDHSKWVPAEVVDEVTSRKSYKVTLDSPGSTVTAETAAALALAYIILGNSTYLTHAKQLFDFAWRTKSDSGYTAANGYYNSWSGFWDEISWAGVWLYIATGDSTYLQIAINASQNWPKNQAGYWDYKWTHCWDDVHYGAALMLAKLTGRQEFIDHMNRYFAYWIPEFAQKYGSSIPGYDGTNIRYTPGGLAYLDQWGSLRYAATTAFLAFVWADYINDPTQKDILYRFAERQINYILGDNPRGGSYIVGFGKNAPRNVHHRTAHASWADTIDVPRDNTHTLFGALVGGPDSSDSWADSRSDYVKNEVALDYNAGLVGALAKMYLRYGGQPLPDFPQNYFTAPYENFRDEYFVRAYVITEEQRSSTISIRVNNRAAWPATVKDRFKVRYFIDLSELFNAGYSLSDLKISVPYSAASSYKITGPVQWCGNVYYVEIDLTGTKIFPGGRQYCEKEIQLRFEAPVWDPKNDWSRQGLSNSIDSDPIYDTGKTPYIVLYDGDKRVWGQEPPCGQATTTTTTVVKTTTTPTTTTIITTTTATTTTSPRTTTTTSPTTTTQVATTATVATTTAYTSYVTVLSGVVSVPVTASAVFTITSPVTTTLTAVTTATVPVTIVTTVTLAVPVTTTVTPTTTTTTTTSPTTTTTSTTTTTTQVTTTTTTTSAAGLVSAPSTKVVVVASRPGGLSGTLQFKVLSGGTISTSSGTISIPSGATVSIDFASSSGSLWIGADGWMSASGIGVNAIYVNGNRVAGSTTITGVTNVRVDLSSIMTSLTLTISGSGWTQITYGGQTLVSGTDSRTIVIPNIAATSSQPLNLNMGSNSIYLEATSNQPQIS